MIRVARLHAGDWYVVASTDAPRAAHLAIDALPDRVFPWDREEAAWEAARLAARWVAAGRWVVFAVDREVGDLVEVERGVGCPWRLIERHLGDGRYYGFRVEPWESNA